MRLKGTVLLEQKKIRKVFATRKSMSKLVILILYMFSPRWRGNRKGL